MRWLFEPAGLSYCRKACDIDVKGPCRQCRRPELHPANQAPLELFMAALSQLRYSMAGPTGLDYQGLIATAQCRGETLTPELFRWVQTCESTYLAVLAEQRPQT